MNISILGFVLGLLLLAIPIYIIYYFKLRVMHRLLASLGRMAIGVAVMAAIVYGALKLNSIAYDIIIFIVFALASSIFALAKARLNITKLIVPVGVGSLVATAFVGFYFLFLVLGEKNPFLPHIFVPMFGIIACSMTGINAKALQTYYSGLLHHGQLYNYLIGNGGSHREATRYFVRRGLQASIVGVAKQMSRIVFVSSPVILLAMVMSGSDAFTAFAFQILFYVAVIAASLISLLIALLIGRKYSFDEYERLKPVFKKKEKAIVSEASTSEYSSTSTSGYSQASTSDYSQSPTSDFSQAPVSGSSSNPEGLQHIDSESQQQAE